MLNEVYARKYPPGSGEPLELITTVFVIVCGDVGRGPSPPLPTTGVQLLDLVSGQPFERAKRRSAPRALSRAVRKA